MEWLSPWREFSRRPLAFISLLLSLLFGTWLLPSSAAAFSATILGDYDNVTVMQVSGSYDVGYINGYPDMSARRDIAKEFYRSHGDDYDMLVIFTNFDFVMPPGASAFYSPAKNDVRGIGVQLAGQELFDYTNAYSSTGAYLARLQGTIDMANVASHALEPADPEFDDTLMTLTHEFLHRWGAYVHFRDGATDSNALLGLADAHWSYLLDSGGSTLYGNNWRDNGDGTFTSIAPEQIREGTLNGRIFSPLDLYLMGLVDKSQVPPLLLIDAPGIDRNQLPAIGDTIPGVAKTVSIDDIIAAEGERIPSAANARKEFRTAFIYAVTPGTWSAGDAQDRGEVAAINRLQTEWEKRFSILTDGTAMMRTAFVVPETVATNPGVTTPTVTPAVTPSVNNGVNWLVSRQQPGGYWQDQPGTDRRDTAAAVAALKSFPAGLSAAAGGQAWLGTVTPENSDFLARKLIGLSGASISELTVLQNLDGGWGSAPGYASNPVDTALVLQALTARGGAGSGMLTAAVNYLHAKQNADGGWSMGRGGSMVQPTARALLALNSHRGSYPIEPAIADGLAWLADRQNGDGGFGNSPSTVIDTAVALQALKATGSSPAAATSAVNYLLVKQASTGSWNDSVFQTAQAVEALHAGQVAADLIIRPEGIRFDPPLITASPATVAVTVTVRNSGGAIPLPAKVALFLREADGRRPIGQGTAYPLPGSEAELVFEAQVEGPFDLTFEAVVDPEGQVAEASDWNNAATQMLPVNLPAPSVGFRLPGGDGLESAAGTDLVVDLAYLWDQPLSVEFGIGVSSTAAPGADFIMLAGTLLFMPGEATKTISLDLIDDSVAEPDETVVVTLANPSAGTIGSGPFAFVIHDDDSPPTVAFEKPTVEQWENAGRVSLPVCLSHPWHQPVTVAYRIDPASSANAGDHLLPPEGIVSFPVGETRQHIDLMIIDDALEEPDETITLTLVEPVNAVIGSARTTCLVRDDDRRPVAGFIDAAAFGDEGVAEVRLAVGLDHPWREPVTLGVALDPASTAGEGADFLLHTRAVTFPPGATLAYVSLQILDDPLVEPQENVVLVLTAADNAVLSAAPITYVIGNNDIPPAVRILSPVAGTLNNRAPLLVYETAVDEVEVRLDGTPVTTRNGQSLEISSDGRHTLTVLATDQEGRTGMAQVEFTVDTAGPEIGIVSPVAGSFPKDTVPLYYALDEGDVTAVTLNGMPVSARSGQALGPLTDGEYLLRVEAVDPLGQHGFRERRFTIAARGPVYPRRVESPPTVVAARELLRYDPQDRRFASDRAGNYFVAVFSYGPVEKYRITVTKYAPDGTPTWPAPAVLGFVNETSMGSVDVDDCGNLYLVGITRDYFVDYLEPHGHSPDEDLFAARIGSGGTVDWVKCWGSGHEDRISGVSLGENGSFYVTGFADAMIDGMPYSSGTDQTYVTVFDAAGHITFNRNLPGLGGETILADRQGNMYVGSGNRLYKYTRDGTQLWVTSFADVVENLAFDGEGNLLVNLRRSPGSSNDCLLRKVSRVDGALLWTSERITLAPTAGRNYADIRVEQMLVDAADDILVTGWFNARLVDFNLDGVGRFIAKFDRYGRILWLQPIAAWLKFDAAPAADGRAFASEWQDPPGGNSSTPEGVVIRKEFFFSTPTAYPDQGQTFYLQSSSQCAGGAYSRTPMVTALATGEQGCTLADQVAATFKGTTRDLLFAYAGSGGYPSPTLVTLTGGPRLLSMMAADASGTGTVSLVEVDPVTKSEVRVLAAKTFALALGRVTLIDEFAGLSGTIGAGRTFGIKLSMLTYDRSTNSIAWGSGVNCPVGGRQLVTVVTSPVDVTPPAAGIDFPLDNSLLRSGHTLISGSAADLGGSGVKIVEVSVDNGLNWQPATDTSADASWATWNYPWVHPLHASYRLLARATDRFGNLSPVSAPLTVAVARPGPELTVDPVVSPARQTSLTITGTVSARATVSATVDLPAGSPASISAVVQNLDGSWAFMVSRLMANSDNVLSVRAVDADGSATRTVIITVDTLPPELTVNPGLSPTYEPTQTIAGTLEAGATLTAEVNPPSVTVPVTVSNGSWSYPAALKSGENTLVFTATDAAGNVTVKSLTITSLPPKLKVSPTDIQAGAMEPVTLVIEDFSDQLVKVAMVRDVAGDGSPDNDPLVRLFLVTDGVPSSNPNVPGDEDGLVNHRIETTLDFRYPGDVQMAPGDYVFLAYNYSDTATVSFRVMETSHLQTIRGYVVDAQNTPLGGASVQLLDKWGNLHGYTFADVTGHYLFNVPTPGEYLLLPAHKGFVFEKTRLAPHGLAAGQQLSADLVMVAGNCALTGDVLNPNTSWSPSRILGGVLVRAESNQYLAASMHHVYGSYEMGLPPGDYNLYVDSLTSQGPGALGYLGNSAPLATVKVYSGSNVRSLLLNKATTLVCGQVRDTANLGVAGLIVEAATGNGSGRFATAVTDGEGHYCLGLMNDGTWQVNLNDAADQPLGYVGTAVAGITATAGPFSGVDLTVYPVEVAIGGSVKEGTQPVAGMAVKATCAATGAVVSGRTAADGSYRLGVHAGTWQIALAAEALGYEPVAPATVSVGEGGAASQNFAVTKPVAPVTVTVNPVTSPTSQSSQTLGGSRSSNATVTVAVNTTATVGTVSYPTATTWQCIVSSLAQGPNAITVTATDGTTQATAPVVTIDYQPPAMTNTIIITKAAYDTRKRVLNVEASSSYQNANLQVVGYGPMTYSRLSKGKHYWTFSQAMATKPATVTVSGPEGSKTATVP